MAQPRPSLTLILDIDERLDSEELRLEIDRCYTYVGSTLVRSHPAPADGSEPINTARFLVKLGTRKYLHSSDEGADALWNEVLERWLYNELHKVGNNMLIFNRRQRDIEGTELFFTWIDIDLENGALSVCVHCNSASGIDPSVSTVITALREAYNNNALGENVTRVYMPAPAAYEQQETEGMRRKQEQDALEEELRKAEEEQRRAEQEAAEAAAQEAFLESPTLVAQASEAKDTNELDSEPQSDQGILDDDVNQQDDPFAVDEPIFDVDYFPWEIEYADGSKRIYDHQRAAFIA